MQFQHVEPDRLERDWPIIAAILAPALRQDPTQTLEGLRKRLADGAEQLLHISGLGHALMVIEVTSELVCWVKYLAGQIEGSPRQRLTIMRYAVSSLEQKAREAGCTEMRLCGRDWSKILPDYLPCDGYPNELRKAL